MNSWAIILEKEDFRFSCAHYLIFPDGSKERLHGHNYRVRVQIQGELTEQGLVIDFLEAKPIIRQLCAELDERWLVPGKHPELKVFHRDDGHTEVVYREAHYLAPTREILVLPINNVSAENLAAWFGLRLLGRLEREFGEPQVQRLSVSISETDGQAGVYVFERDASFDR